MMEYYGDIPRLYTALAEWLSCIIYILLFENRWEKKRIVIISGCMLIVQSLFMVFTENVIIFLWLPIMALAVLWMYIFLLLCNNNNLVVTGYHCAKAFLIAEFMASFEWQIESFILKFVGEIFIPIRFIIFFLIYGMIFIIIKRIEMRMEYRSYCKELGKKELITVICIAVFVFMFSNISFVTSNLPFSASEKMDIFAMRTLGDLCGLIILFAFQMNICEKVMEQELFAIRSMYKKQYEQYRYYQNSMEVIHMKYHDLKHQITGLRGEKDEIKREEWLNQLENELDENHLITQTGNSVLDTMLAAKLFYAQKNKIRITCVADGKLLDFMHVADICTIFGNALDNAIESVVMLEDPKKRLIHVVLSKQKNFIFIKILNYIMEDIEFHNQAFPETSKKDKVNHGYGLKSIQKVVEKYHGNLSVQAKNHWFELRILIPESK